MCWQSVISLLSLQMFMVKFIECHRLQWLQPRERSVLGLVNTKSLPSPRAAWCSAPGHQKSKIAFDQYLKVSTVLRREQTLKQSEQSLLGWRSPFLPIMPLAIHTAHCLASRSRHVDAGLGLKLLQAFVCRQCSKELRFVLENWFQYFRAHGHILPSQKVLKVSPAGLSPTTTDRNNLFKWPDQILQLHAAAGVGIGELQRCT